MHLVYKYCKSCLAMLCKLLTLNVLFVIIFLLSISTDALAFTLSVNNANQLPGDTAVFSSDLSGTAVDTILTNGKSITIETAGHLPPYTWNVVIPKGAAGTMTFQLHAIVDGVISSSNSVVVNVVPDNTKLTEIFFLPSDPVYLTPGKTQQVAVTGSYSDGIARNLTSSSTGTVYSENIVDGLTVTPGDSPVISISADGLIQALTPGTAEVVATNNGKTATTRVFVEAVPLVVSAGGPYKGSIGTPISFDASSSSTTEGKIIQYEWDWNNDGVFDAATANSVVNQSFSGPYNGLVTLRVLTDLGAVATETASLNVINSTFVVTGSGSAEGTVSCQSPVNFGANSICTITPTIGHHLATLTDNGVNKLASVNGNSYTISNVQENHAVVAVFAINTYTVTVGGTGAGTVSCQSPVNYGANSICTVTPTTGHHLDALIDNGVDKLAEVTGSSYTISNVQANHAIVATFAIDKFAVNFVTDGNGTLTGSSSQMVNYNSSTTPLTAVPSTGYHFVNWTGTGGFATTSANPLTVTNVTAALNIKANFAINSFSVNFVSGGNGTLTGNTSQTINYNASATPVTAVPESGYYFVKWTSSDGYVSNSNPLVLTNVTAKKTIVANFAISANITSKDATKPFAYKGGKLTLNFTATPAANIDSIKAAITSSPWIKADLSTIKFAKGKGRVSYFVEENPEPVARSGSITIANDTYAINQAPHPCVIKLVTVDPLQQVSATGGEQSVAVDVEPNSCQWKVASYKISRDLWFSVAGSFPAVDVLLAGDKTLQGSVSANTSGKARTNAIVIMTVAGKSKKKVSLKQGK